MSRANLSVIITCWNKPHEQLIECVNSVKEQTVEPLETILVDDCSDAPHAHAYATSILLPKNVGVAKARDVGVRMSRGKLILFLDADDKLAPDFIEQCGRVIDKCDIAYPNMLIFGAVERIRIKEAPRRINPQYFISKSCAIPVTSMMHRHVYDSLGGFADLPVFEDWDFWIRAMFKGYTFRRANTYLWYRQNKNSRNHATLSLKSSIYTQITAPYEVVDGKLTRKESHETLKAG